MCHKTNRIIVESSFDYFRVWNGIYRGKKTHRFRQTRQSHLEDVISRLNYSFTNALFACSAFIYILLFSCVLRAVARQSAYMCMNGFNANVYRLFKRRSVSLPLALETFAGSQLLPQNGNLRVSFSVMVFPLKSQLKRPVIEVLVPQNR